MEPDLEWTLFVYDKNNFKIVYIKKVESAEALEQCVGSAEKIAKKYLKKLELELEELKLK